MIGAREIFFSGHHFSAKGIKADPTSFQFIDDLQVGDRADSLGRFIGIIGYMRRGMPGCAQLIQPLDAMLTKAANIAGSREASKLKHVKLAPLGWDASFEELVRRTKEAMRQSLRLAHRDQSLTLCLFTNASITGWSGVYIPNAPQAS